MELFLYSKPKTTFACMRATNLFTLAMVEAGKKNEVYAIWFMRYFKLL